MTSKDDEPEAPASSVCYLGEPTDPDPRDPQAVALWRRGERARLRAERMALSVEVRQAKAEALTRHLDTFVASRLGDLTGRVVSGYWPIKGELDLRPWMTALHERGAMLALPVVEVPGTPLIFRRWSPGLKMERGHWGIPVPPAESLQMTPEVSLAPVMGWDGEGYRLGYGGGYFDRTLASLSPVPLAIGVGVQAARISSIHPQPHDIALSAIVTEAGLQFARA
ncbi:5-formyltetrahydrofolate cyclo-ligase [Rubellimicrobium mesophilum DSM 19309]|uniref:5-formyltetrahydrofolate cyclo-ligase n=1 Tax=Rubellimicrobium mesophilum DSM 19309 TaxID=442562 RepID=A0A017HSX9_9RHOB|nr:5-formyltetrahydrofolate cyclo-ligase [Rubellimicrobium mesophilum]EYD77435.1 5-formyltetrahydrofolate cyclo-ligase [Rubellimicrobium mesophilum DSM 19309]